MGASTTWFGQAVRIGLNLIGLPIMFRFLSQEELGIWLILGQSSIVLSMLLEAGLTPTITRRIAFAAGKRDFAVEQYVGEESRYELARLIKSGEISYQVLSIAVLLFSLVFGSLYFWNLQLHQLSTMTVWLAWLLMSCGYATIAWSGIWMALITGLGYVAKASLIATSFGIATIAIQIVTVVAGGGLVWLAMISVITGIAYRIGLRNYLRHQQPELFSIAARWDPIVVKDMVGPAIRSWLTAAGLVALYKTDQYFIALYIDPAQVPAYYAAYTLLHNLTILALTLGQTASVFVSQLWHSRRLEAIHGIVLSSLRVCLILMGSGVVVLAVNGHDFISIWVGSEHFVGQPVLMVLCVMFLLCAQQNALLAFSRATENEVYAPAFLIAGGLNVLFAWALVERFGLFGIVLATLLAQLLTTNWIVVIDSLRRLRIKATVYFWNCVVPCSVASLITLLAMMPIARGRWLLPSPADRSVAAIALAGCLILANLWLLGGTGPKKARVVERLRVALRAGLPGTGP